VQQIASIAPLRETNDEVLASRSKMNEDRNPQVLPLCFPVRSDKGCARGGEAHRAKAQRQLRRLAAASPWCESKKCTIR